MGQYAFDYQESCHVWYTEWVGHYLLTSEDGPFATTSNTLQWSLQPPAAFTPEPVPRNAPRQRSVSALTLNTLLPAQTIRSSVLSLVLWFYSVTSIVSIVFFIRAAWRRHKLHDRREQGPAKGDACGWSLLVTLLPGSWCCHAGCLTMISYWPRSRSDLLWLFGAQCSLVACGLFLIFPCFTVTWESL